jgi:hypothetical protein
VLFKFCHYEFGALDQAGRMPSPEVVVLQVNISSLTSFPRLNLKPTRQIIWVCCLGQFESPMSDSQNWNFQLDAFHLRFVKRPAVISSSHSDCHGDPLRQLGKALCVGLISAFQGLS